MELKTKFWTVLMLVMITSCKAQSNEHMHTNSQLHYIIRPSSDSSARTPLLVLLHGHGSNETDLFALQAEIPAKWNVVSIQGPYKLSENSYRWYDVKMMSGKISINIEEEEKSKKQIVVLINELIKNYKIDSNQIVVAGFSQGANMAQSLGLSEPDLVAGFAVFSGRYVEEIKPFISQTSDLKNSKAFLSHGIGDQLLPKTYADENLHQLALLGLDVHYCEDTNGHSISAKQWTEFSNWLSTLFP